jgi:parallel beta-helix repeat protein
MFAVVFNVRPVRAQGEQVYIYSDGSVSPSNAPISSVDNTTYTMTGNIMSPSYAGIIVERNNTVIDGSGWTLQGDGNINGFYLNNVSYITIRNVNFNDFDCAISAYFCSNIIISGNNMTNNVADGVDLYYSSNCIVSGNNVTNGVDGIDLTHSSNNSVSGNTIADNSNDAIFIDSSNFNSITGNTLTNNFSGIELDWSSNNSISGNTFTGDGLTVYDSHQNLVENNTVNGMPLVYLEGVTNYVVGDAGQVVLVSCDGITVENLSLSNICVGVQLWQTNDSIVSDNNITNNCDGVDLYYSCSNVINGNMFFGNGLYVWYSYNNVVADNMVNGRPLVYLEGVSGYTVEQDAGQVILVDSTYIIVENLDLSNTSQGVELWGTNDTEIVGNNIANNNDCGILLDSSSDGNIIGGNNLTQDGAGIMILSSSDSNLVSGNIVSDNGMGIMVMYSCGSNSVTGNEITNNIYGLWLFDLYTYNSNNSFSANNVTNNNVGINLIDASGNSIYHNNFINNTSQVGSSQSTNAWDDGYPSGGNYWSDYEGMDCYSGPNQNVVGSDGIGDTPYVIDANNMDHYPLMGPFSSVYYNITDASISYVSNSTVSGFQLDGSTISFTVSGQPDTMGFCTMAIPVAALLPPYTIEIDGNPVNYTVEYQSAIQSIIYFTYHHSTHDVSVTGTAPDIVVTNVAPLQTVVGKGYGANVAVTVVHLSTSSETFNFTVYANNVAVTSQNVTLSPQTSTTLAFAWNTTGLAYGNYALSVYAEPLAGAASTADNNCTGGIVRVSIPGDVDGNGVVNMGDVMTLLYAFGSTLGKPNWNPNCDIEGNGKIDMGDIVIALMHFGQHYP